MDQLAQATYSTINDLRIKKQKAVDVLDFETAEDMENQIQQELLNFSKYQCQDALSIAKSELKKYHKLAEKRLADEAEESRQNTQMIYSKYQTLVEQTEERHISELMEIEQDRTYTLITESERDVEEQITMLEEAKAEAKVCHFDKAKELRQRAQDIAKEELERRRVETEDRFAKLKEVTIDAQKEELEKLTQDHEAEVKAEQSRQELQFAKSIQEFIDEINIICTKACTKFNAVAAKNMDVGEFSSDIRELCDEEINFFKSKLRVVPVMTQYEKLKFGLTENPNTKSKSDLAKTAAPFTSAADRSIKGKSALAKTTGNIQRQRPMSSIGLLSLRPMSKASVRKP